MFNNYITIRKIYVYIFNDNANLQNKKWTYELNLTGMHFSETLAILRRLGGRNFRIFKIFDYFCLQCLFILESKIN